MTGAAPVRASALDGWFDVLRKGTFTDMSGRRNTFSEQDIDRIVANHDKADPVPVVVGHPEADAPAYAWLADVRRVGDRLQTKLRDIDPEFRAAVEDGRYAGRSVALDGTREDGWRLRHVGFLGGAKPAVDGLAPTQFSGKPDAVLTFAAFAASERERFAWGAIGRLLRGLRDQKIEERGVEAANEVFPEWELNQIERAAHDTADGPAFADPKPDTAANPESTPEEDPEVPPDDKTPTPAEREAEFAAERTALDEREDKLKDREAALAAAERERAADEELQKHVADGRVLPAERPRLAALLASLPDDTGDKGAVLKFAAGDGDDAGTVEETPRAAFSAFIESLPIRVRYGEVAPAEAAVTEMPAADVSARAEAHMAAQAEKGIEITPTQAVDDVRAGRDQNPKGS